MRALLILVVGLLVNGSVQSQEKLYSLAIHGGAGTIKRSSMTQEQEAEYKGKLKHALDMGIKILESGGTSEDAVIAAIKILEDSPLFNAGKGAVMTYQGHHELDASVMNGKTRQAGAVAGVTNVKNPILLAKAVMEQSIHVMLSGKGAEEFAMNVGLETVSNSYFTTPRRLEAWKRAIAKIETSSHWYLTDDYRFGTVGAVALDKNGNLYAGTSTGGMTAKRWGRIGDSPVIGAGTFADNDSCAVSATGHGEYFIRYQVASDICARVKYQAKSIQQAGDEVIHQQLAPIGGTGGVIIADRNGNIAMPFNTSGMYRASRDGTGNITVAIYN